MTDTRPETPILLSICMATFRRGDFIGETLASIVPQLTDAMELVVVDGASPDATPEVVSQWQLREPRLVYHREPVNEGFDRDYDKAVGYARGKYCWLMTDDDLLVPGTLAAVMERLQGEPDVVVVNARVLDKELRHVLKERLVPIHADAHFDEKQLDTFFRTAGSYLSFIGAVVVRREAWLQRERVPYYGSMFVHMGVIFQRPALSRAVVIAEPMIHIRYGNAMWTARGYDIWTRLWPQLVWSFEDVGAGARAKVTARHPAASLKTLLWYRAIGAFGPRELEGAAQEAPRHALASWIARVPLPWVNAALAVFCAIRGHVDDPMMLYELERAQGAPAFTRWLSRRVRTAVVKAGAPAARPGA